MEDPQTGQINGDANNPEDEELDHQLTITSMSGLLPPVTDRVAREKSNKARSQRNARRTKEKERQRVEELRSRFVAPDGGYGWLVAFGAFLVQFWIAGLIKSYGVILMEIMQMYPDASASLASWIPAILSTICLVSSPICSGLCQKYSCRSVVFVGGILCWLGISLSFFTTDLIQLCLTFGVLTGLGAGLSTTPGIIMTSRYFNKRRALANGICVSGTAAGSMVIPPLMEVLVPLYGFRGSILILGACMLHVCFCASLYRPVEVHQAIVELDEKRKSGASPHLIQDDNLKKLKTMNPEPSEQLITIEASCNTLQVPGKAAEDSVSVNDSVISAVPARLRGSTMVHSIEDLSTDSTFFYKEKLSGGGAGSATSLRPTDDGSLYDQYPSKPSGCLNIIRRYIDLSLVSNPLFLLMTSTVMLMAVGCPHALFFLPAHATSVGLSKSDSSLLLSISAVLDLIGRLGFGYIADLNLFSKSKAYGVSMMMSGISVICMPLATTFAEFAIIVSFYGFGLGCWFLLIPVLLSEHHGTEAIASSYGLVRLFQGMITLVVPPIIGFTKDTVGDYQIGFYFMGVCMVVGSVVINFVPCAKRMADEKKDKLNVPATAVA